MQNGTVNRIESNLIVNWIALNLQKSYLNRIENLWIVNRIDLLSTQRFTALPVTQHTGRNWLNAETVKSCEGVRCRPARSSTFVCQRSAVHQRIGGGNTPSGVSPHPQGTWLALRLVLQGDGIHYPVGQPLLGDSLPFLLSSVADKELFGTSEAPGAVHVYAQCSYRTQQH